MPANGGAEKLLFAGREKMTRDRRFSKDGSRVTISNARPKDAGTYYCMFDLQPPVVLRHTIDVQYAPTVRAMGRPEQHIPRGQSVSLECQAEGNPEPIIRWSRQEGPLPSGKRSEEVRPVSPSPLRGTLAERLRSLFLRSAMPTYSPPMHLLVSLLYHCSSIHRHSSPFPSPALYPPCSRLPSCASPPLTLMGVSLPRREGKWLASPLCQSLKSREEVAF